MIRNISKPIFSGHESFACKSHWLKRGYDFVNAGNNFNDDEAVVHLGVGKNMVASIRFWLKAFATFSMMRVVKIPTLKILELCGCCILC